AYEEHASCFEIRSAGVDVEVLGNVSSTGARLISKQKKGQPLLRDLAGHLSRYFDTHDVPMARAPGFRAVVAALWLASFVVVALVFHRS
ncbi:MAG TPA: hypothetical protein VMB50_03735, partial [Myxococcales bacterium]|nr:hypothetical protein [Myxococcales bacterium]